MPKFTLDGHTHEYLQPELDARPEDAHSWEYGHWPRVEARIPLVGGGTISVYAVAMRWAGEQILVRWQDDADHYHDAWVPTSTVRRLTASEWDIIAFHATPENLRSVQWGKRMPGFLPE
jgi:hypothetical protein